MKTGPPLLPPPLPVPRPARQSGYALALTLFVLFLLALALALIGVSLSIRMRMVKVEAESVVRNALADAALDEALANLALDESFPGTGRHPLGEGEIESRVLDLGSGQYAVTATGRYAGKARRIRATVLCSPGNVMIQSWQLVGSEEEAVEEAIPP